MAKYKIAHLCEQGQDMIIVPLENNFHHATGADQQNTIDYLQACSIDAGLAGKIVPVWLHGGRVYFITPWHPFFKSLSWDSILYNLNKELICD